MASSPLTRTAFLAALTPETCPICYEEFTKPIKTECNHSFCLECAETWFQTHTTCPSCRTVVYKENREEPQQLTSEEHIRDRLLFCLASGALFEAGQAPLDCFIFSLGPRYRTALGRMLAEDILEEMHATGDEIRLDGDTIYDVATRSGLFQYALRLYIDSTDSRVPLTGPGWKDVRAVIEGVNRYIRGGQFGYVEAIVHLQAAARLGAVDLWGQYMGMANITHVYF